MIELTRGISYRQKNRDLSPPHPRRPGRAPSLHSSELANEHRAGSRGTAPGESYEFVKFIGESYVFLRR